MWPALDQITCRKLLSALQVNAKWRQKFWVQEYCWGLVLVACIDGLTDEVDEGHMAAG